MMAAREVKNVAASVRQRLLNTARATGEPFDLLLARYGIERFLFRLSRSTWRGEFVLKGAMLFATWHEIPMRPTRDVDLLGFGTSDVARLADVFRSICEQPVDDDGIVFDSLSVRTEQIRESNDYHGVRVRLHASLAGARIPLQVDVGFGDAVVPKPEEIEFPTLLGSPAPRLRAYPTYTVISEKLQALTVLGMANTRMKDYYDLWVFAMHAELHGKLLVGAIQATFSRRRTPIPDRLPIGLTAEFSEDAEKQRQWRAFAAKLGADNAVAVLDNVMSVLQEFLAPPLEATRRPAEEFDGLWRPGGPWARR